MKIWFLSILSTLFITFSVAFAMASSTTVSDIKGADLVCINLTKSEALVFKTSAPQKIWRTIQDREGRVKNFQALQLGQAEIAGNLAARRLDSFKASITEGYQLTGAFDLQSAGEFALSVTSSYLPDGNRGNVTDHYNCTREN